jgi:hypothetical protein
MQSSTKAGNDAVAAIPPGYSMKEMSDGRNYLVPDFMIDATNLAIQSQAMKRSLNVQQAPGGVSNLFRSLG